MLYNILHSKLLYIIVLFSVTVSCSDILTTSDGDYTIKGTPPNDEVWYQTTDGKKLTLSGIWFDEYEDEVIADRVIKSHTYKKGIGVFKFVKPISTFSTVYADGERLCAINLPESVKGVSLEGCINLTDIKLPSKLEIIGDLCFDGCRRITHINIPNSVTRIGFCAFSDCTSLTNINIPNSVTYMGDMIFDGCINLEIINLSSALSTIHVDWFSGCNNLKLIYIPCKTPPYLWTSNDVTLAAATKFVVPKASLEVYRQAKGWREYEADRFIGYDFD